MIRLFEQHKIRSQKELDGIWKFVKEDGKEYELPVPGCWEQHPELLTFRGKGSFYKKVYVRKKTNIRLEFKGVSHTADVYFDDKFVVHHYNAFTAFSGIVKEVEPGEHTIRVDVDNTFGQHSSLHVPNDYYTYGGVTRPVAFEEIGDVYIKNVYFRSYKQEKKWCAEITVEIENLGSGKNENAKTSEEDKANTVDKTNEAARTKQLEIAVNLNNIVSSKKVEIKGNTVEKITWNQEFFGVEEWNPESPKLYYLETTLKSQEGGIIDDFIDRVGFREISMKGYRLMLNGQPVFLKGFNRHEDYGTIGCALPLQLIVQDMDLMQEVGSNAVRTCHYPNDERFLDLCDERGMMVWEENHARGFDLARMQNPNFEKQCEACIAEMIEQHYNHPAIVIWGILNECASETTEGREMYRKQYEQIKSLDTSRPTTSATCRHFTDICLDLPDIVSFNMYSGWYQDVTVKERHEKEMDWIASAGGEGKPVIVSEFGAAAIYGYRDRGRCKWSEERQADLIRENLQVYRQDSRITGTFIWQFADCKVTEEEWFATRARCHNNKGVVDEYRRPKEAFDVVKELFPTMTGGED